ncbi:MAG TPA: endolytic transglycosylase MltG [Dissulfurispiraceae bacterium]|nr:endolytic transglycosylase MltG [Dissulfurispiraceae bacterium]
MRKSTRNVLAAIFFIFPVYILIQLFVPVYDSATPVEIEIPQGASYKNAIDILTDNKLIRDRFLFLVLGKITGVDRKMRAGYYNFWSRISPFDVFQQLKKGKIIEYEITVVEGDSLLEIGEKLEAKKLVTTDVFRNIARDKSILASLNIDAPSAEGYLFPETYKLPKGARPADIIKLMVGKLRESYTDEIKARMQQSGWTENAVLTLASIIEKEAETDEERPIISAVYRNRLNIGMPLQADPTAIYGVKNSKTRIVSSDLRNKTPYNTYVISGLPPGPIASPGLKSIRAALSPAKVPYIYFVSRGDGTHIFTSSLSDHNNAVRLVRGQNGKEG